MTKYRNWSTVELLRLFAEKRLESPVIEELCHRLEEKLGPCPVCEAEE